MLKSLWNWIFRIVLGVGLAYVVLMVLLAIGMNTANVTQSNGEVEISEEANRMTLCGSLPATATKIHYCSGSVGMGGRLRIYRFSAPLEDLHSHALNEFAAHWDKPKVTKSAAVSSPITEHEVERYKSAFGVKVEWMLSPSTVTGTLYESADGQVLSSSYYFY